LAIHVFFGMASPQRLTFRYLHCVYVADPILWYSSVHLLTLSFLCQHLIGIPFLKYQVKVFPVLNYLSTTPWRRMNEWMYRATFSWPQH
jgi:hypothetical protein